MSLTSHLKNQSSPIRQFIRQRFSQTTKLTEPANKTLQDVGTILPIQADKSYPYGLIGTAIDYRIRYAFNITPYRELVAWRGAIPLTYKALKSKEDLPIDFDEIMSVVRVIVGDFTSGIARGPYPMKLILAFFESLGVTLEDLQPVGRTLPPDAEEILERYCFVLALFEEIFRAGLKNASRTSLLLIPKPRKSIDEMLAIPQVEWIDDLSAIFALFYKHHNQLLNHPHVLNPDFVGSRYVGGADADMIVDNCLIDIKTSIYARIEPIYLHQLIGYLLLDFDDAFHLDSVGIYLARQGELLQWDISDFIRELTGENTVNVASLRQEFRTFCLNLRVRPR